MKICLLCVEIFAWGKYGGFGRAARTIGRELVRGGVEVSAVVPQRPGQKRVERLDGMRVLAFPAHRPWQAEALCRECDADIYHSQEASLSSWLAMRAAPGKKHLITFRDHKFLADWLVELRHPSRNHVRTLLAWLYERNALVTRAIRRADALAVCAPYMRERIADGYGLTRALVLLPTPVDVPRDLPEKPAAPTVCFLGRWDPRKRPALFLELVREFPDVRFVAVGDGQNDVRDASLRRRFASLANLEMPGFVNQFESDALANLLRQSHVLVNTSLREGLPTSFLEALAQGAALLGRVDPDNIVSRFGRAVQDDDFAGGLAALLKDGAWRDKGAAGHRYVRENFELEHVIRLHLETYRELLDNTALNRSRTPQHNSL